MKKVNSKPKKKKDMARDRNVMRRFVDSGKMSNLKMYQKGGIWKSLGRICKICGKPFGKHYDNDCDLK